jgi:hypothetical protein
MSATTPAQSGPAKKLGCGCLGLAGAFVIFFGTVGFVRGLTGHTGTTGNPAGTAPAQVTYDCTGAGIVTILYGPGGTDSAGSGNLPFTESGPYSPTALDYDVTAQLQGSGDVSCTTTVDTGTQAIAQTATASGGYNIARAEVCSTGVGWKPC